MVKCYTSKIYNGKNYKIELSEFTTFKSAMVKNDNVKSATVRNYDG